MGAGLVCSQKNQDKPMKEAEHQCSGGQRHSLPSSVIICMLVPLFFSWLNGTKGSSLPGLANDNKNNVEGREIVTETSSKASKNATHYESIISKVGLKGSICFQKGTVSLSAVRDTRHLCLTGKQSLPPWCVGFSLLVLKWKSTWKRKRNHWCY